MAFVVPQHLPRATFGQGSSYGSSTSHSEPILRKLAEVTRESLTSTEASKWVKEIQKDIQDTKARVHRCIHKDLPTFERQLASAKQIRGGLHELTAAADDLTSQVQRPPTGIVPAVLSTLSAHSALAQDAQDANILHAVLTHLTECRDEFKTLSNLVESGRLPAAVRKSEETQYLIQSAPKPLERSAVMKDLSRMARVLGDRVQEQLGDAYSRAVAVTQFPTGVTVLVSPRITIRDSNSSVTLSELFTSLKTSSLQEYLSALRKDVLARALEPVLIKPSRLVVSMQEATLTIDHGTLESNVLSPTQQAQEALQHTNSIVTFLHDTLFPVLPSKETFAAQLTGPIVQALVKHVLRASIPRSGSLKDIPDFIRVTERAVEVEVALFNMGLRSGEVREWAQAAPLHYERLRREDLVQRARGAVLEHDGTAVVLTRLIATEEESKEVAQGETEDDPWAFGESAPTTAASVPIIATPAPKSQPQSAVPPEATPTPTPATATVPTTPAGYTVGESSKAASPPPEDAEEDGWGFDDDEVETTEPQKAPENIPAPESAHGDTSEDEPDVEVYAGNSQSEAEASEKSGGTSHLTELLSAPQSDAEIVNSTPQSSEESDPWDDDPWADSEGEIKNESEPVSIPPSKSPAPTLSPTKAPESPKPKSASPVISAPVPAVVEVPPSPAFKTPAPRVARGLQRFAQKNRGSGASSPAVSNSSPTASFAPSSAFGTAPSSAFPTSAIGHSSPSKPNQPLPSSSAPFSPPDPPKIAPPVTPAMRRAQQQVKVASQGSTRTGPGRSTSPLASPTKKWNALPQDDRASSVGSVSGLFGPDSHRRRYAGSEVGSQVGSVVGSQVGTGSQVGVGSQVGMGSQVGVGSQVGTFTSGTNLEQTPAMSVQVAKPEPASETYMVSTKAQKILALAEEALNEGKELVFSNVFPPGTTPTPGTLILGCIPSFFDLFRALVPVAHGGPMAASAGIAMRFSNDCLYMSEEIGKIIAGVPTGAVGDGVRPKLQESQEKLKIFSESWFEEVLDNEKSAIAKYLEPTEGFRDMHDQTRYQECRRAITRCTHAISKFSRDTKPVLSFIKYRLALGTLVEDVLSRLTDDILSMHDIPETESHRLHDICKVMRTFESLFVADGESDSMVSQYVPSWFKYSYLSELLEASLADIRHLFDMGALVDFSEQDLAHLVHIGNLQISSDNENEHAVSAPGNRDTYTQGYGLQQGQSGDCCALGKWLQSSEEQEITITDAQKSSEGAGSVYIAYVIRTGNVETRRRYSEFESLRNSLSKLYPTLIVPPIPSKQTIGDYAIKQSKAKEDANLIARRRRMLQVFLNRIASNPILSLEHVFHRFLERDVSWSEVLNSPPITLLPKNILKAPAHNPLEPSPAHDALPVPSPSHPLRHPDQRFLDSESFTQKFEAHLTGPLEKVTRRTSKRWAEYAHDTAELGAALNALSLSLPPHESDAVERTGQAVDAAYVDATRLVQSIEAGWTEPLREYAMFAGIIRRLLAYRHQKHVQYEMTRESLESKQETLEEYERSEAEAQRLQSALSAATAPRRSSPSLTPNNPNVALPSPSANPGNESLSPRPGASPAPSADSLTQSPTQLSIPDPDDFNTQSAWGGNDGPSWGQGARSQAWANRISSGLSSTIGAATNVAANAASSVAGASSEATLLAASSSAGVNRAAGPTHRRGGSGAKGFLNALSHSFQGIMDVDPEVARRNGISRTRDGIKQLDDALLVATQDLKYASSTIQADLDRFQRQKVADIRDMCIAMAMAHRDWAKNNLKAWEEAKKEVAKIEPHPNCPPGNLDVPKSP
ncbi:Sorting nexin-41 [Cryptococcus neoformans var, neoformans B-3501A] [Rhizoctonia solani]|uniref:Sorting nexin-41 [Cryptococcus neoformans var, neoformans B-3501A] n=1 Tax=Rhizoctonia solani TaxID=456999 RepID=A0A0K6GHU4_9AGAM|nr:Sorting nexin-41 [Cryptococcus neoformans var, neoformans B-3501A] [Rhizoctonia solani]